MGYKKTAGLERKPAALKSISCTSERLILFALFSPLVCFTVWLFNRLRVWHCKPFALGSGEKCHPSGDDALSRFDVSGKPELRFCDGLSNVARNASSALCGRK